MNDETPATKAERFVQLIAQYGVQCSETKELAPTAEFAEAIKELYQPEKGDDARDARRYRWLRECTGPVCAGIAESDPTQWLDTTDLDAAIDDARQVLDVPANPR